MSGAKVSDGIRAFMFGWLQVALVALNTWQLSHRKVGGALVVGFLISLTWTFNVRNVAQSGWAVRIAYSTGAMAGTGTGMLISHLIYR